MKKRLKLFLYYGQTVITLFAKGLYHKKRGREKTGLILEGLRLGYP